MENFIFCAMNIPIIQEPVNRYALRFHRNEKFSLKRMICLKAFCCSTTLLPPIRKRFNAVQELRMFNRIIQSKITLELVQ